MGHCPGRRYSGFQVTRMIECGQKSKPPKIPGPKFNPHKNPMPNFLAIKIYSRTMYAAWIGDIVGNNNESSNCFE